MQALCLAACSQIPLHIKITFSSGSTMLCSLWYLSTAKGSPVTRFTPDFIIRTVYLNCATTSAKKQFEKGNYLKSN